ncbi:MAG: hypothetical protein GY694_01175 [Gammaproteobacteria bacterium]|nr:hypothetical protein [Gammaproteobacteria bacterium]
MSRVVDMPVYEQRNIEISASLYNLWRRAKLHAPQPIRFPLEGYRGLVMILDHDEWLCADETQNDLPVVCWHKFEAQGRDALHLPIQCSRNYYHFAAEKIQQSVLKLMAEHLELLLNKYA